MQTLYEAVGRDEGLLCLARAWHDRVRADEIVSHAFSHGFHPEHIERLAAYWAEALGGPPTYSTTLGDETSVVRMHSGNGPHEEMDRRAIACFDQALTDVGLIENGPLRQALHDYFAWATTTTMSGYHDSADDVPLALASLPGHGTASTTRVEPGFAAYPRPTTTSRATITLAGSRTRAKKQEAVIAECGSVNPNWLHGLYPQKTEVGSRSSSVRRSSTCCGVVG